MNPPDETGARPTARETGRLSELRLGRRYMLAGVAALGAVGVTGAGRAVAIDTLEPDWEDGDRANPVLSRYGDWLDDDWDDDDWDDDDWDDDDFRDNAETGAIYQDFVARLAENLGDSDAAAVDAAIRDTLTAMVEERFAAGEISRNLANDVIAWIGTSHLPVAALLVGGMRRRRRD